jgi:hypothetical protein
MKKLFFILIIVSLSGCSTMKDLVVTEVKVPVIVPCRIVAPDKPAMPLTDALNLDGDIFSITQKALAEIELRKGYEVKLESAIKECNK